MASSGPPSELSVVGLISKIEQYLRTTDATSNDVVLQVLQPSRGAELSVDGSQSGSAVERVHFIQRDVLQQLLEHLQSRTREEQFHIPRRATDLVESTGLVGSLNMNQLLNVVIDVSRGLPEFSKYVHAPDKLPNNLLLRGLLGFELYPNHIEGMNPLQLVTEYLRLRPTYIDKIGLGDTEGGGSPPENKPSGRPDDRSAADDSVPRLLREITQWLNGVTGRERLASFIRILGNKESGQIPDMIKASVNEQLCHHLAQPSLDGHYEIPEDLLAYLIAGTPCEGLTLEQLLTTRLVIDREHQIGKTIGQLIDQQYMGTGETTTRGFVRRFNALKSGCAARNDTVGPGEIEMTDMSTLIGTTRSGLSGDGIINTGPSATDMGATDGAQREASREAATRSRGNSSGHSCGGGDG